MNQARRNRLKIIEKRLSNLYLETRNRDELEELANFVENRIFNEVILQNILAFFSDDPDEVEGAS